VLDTATITPFDGGVYLDWKVSGHVVITVTRLTAANAVLSGLFFDAARSRAVALGPRGATAPARWLIGPAGRGAGPATGIGRG
jgi:hypothetical protein